MTDLPDFICIGAQKAGTSWLHATLMQTPHVWLPPVKELHYFDRMFLSDERKKEMLATTRKRMRVAARKNPDVPEAAKYALSRKLAETGYLSEEWYRAIFSLPDRKGRPAGEITPSYLMLKPKAITAIKALVPPVRLIACLREPLARDLSQLRMKVMRSKTPPQTDEDWKTLVDTYILGRPRGDYVSSLPRWWKHFPREQLLILPFGQIKRQPATVIRKIEDFLGVPHFDGYKQLSEPVHESQGTAIPAWVVDQLDERAKPQRAFLIQHFGRDFLEDSS